MDEDSDRRRGERRSAARSDRVEAIHELSDAYAKVGAALSDVGTGIDYLAGLVKTLILVMIVASLLLLVPAGYNVWNGYQGSKARSTLLDRSADIQRTADEVHGAVTPGQPIYEQGQRQTAQAVASLVDEEECRVENALHGGPDVPSGASCLTTHPELSKGAP